MTTLISLIPAAFFFARYLATRKPADLGLLLTFLLISQVGGKRGTLVYAPVVMATVYFLHVRLKGVAVIRFSRGLVSLSLLILLSVYAFVRLNPYLNPDEEIGGRFDLTFALGFVLDYVDQGTNVYDFSRAQALPYIFSYLFNQDAPTVLFGEGAGRLTRANPEVPEDMDAVTYYYGIRYGGRVGIIWVFLQIGVVGTLVFTALLLRILRQILRFPAGSYHVPAMAGILLVVVLDIYTYSMVTFRFFSIYGMFFTYVAFMYRDMIQGTEFLKASTPVRTNRAPTGTSVTG
jgi:hypothetical protein